FRPNFRGWGLDKNLKLKSPPYRGVRACQPRGSCRSRMPHTPALTSPSALRSHALSAPNSPLPDCLINVHNMYSRRRAGKVYPYEIGIQETRTNHRKFDSQTALSHRARGRAADGRRSQVWSLRPSRRDNDPGRLSARFAGVRGLRPAMAADRIIRG